MVRHSICALASGLVLALGFTTTSFAAGDGFCHDYARAALNQVRGGMSHHRCREQMQGPRWSSDWRDHYNWCRTASRDQADSERDARRATLDGCAR